MVFLFFMLRQELANYRKYSFRTPAP